MADGDGGGDNGGSDDGTGDDGMPDDGDGMDDPTAPEITLFSISQNSGIVSFNDPETLDGESIVVTTDLELSGDTVARSRDAAIDAGGSLYIASEGTDSIAIYDPASIATGDRAPSRNVSGEASEINSPIGIAIDRDENMLYLANGGGDEFEVRVWKDIQMETFDGDMEPDRKFNIGDPNLTPDQLVFAGGSLYLVDDMEVFIFDDVINAENEVTPSRQFSSTLWVGQVIISVDVNDRLWVADREADTIYMWTEASMLDGAADPALTLTVGNIFDTMDLTFAAADSQNRLYVSDRNRHAIYAFDDIALLVDGENTPDREIQGDDFRLPDRLLIWEE